MPEAQHFVPVIGANISTLRASADKLPPGYVDYVLTHGRVSGEMVLLNPDAQEEFRQKYPMPGIAGVYDLSALKISAPYQPAGFLEFLLSRGTVKDGFVILDNSALKELNEKFPSEKRAIVLNVAQLKASEDIQTPGFVEFVLTRGKIVDDMVIIDPALRKEMPKPPRQKRIILADLKADAQYQPDGYYEHVLAHGKINGDSVILSEAADKEIKGKFPLVKFTVHELEESALRRPQGFVEYVLANGKNIAGTVVFTQDAARKFNQKFPLQFLPTPPQPTMAELATNFAGAMAGWAKAGFKTVEREVYDRRIATCEACEHWIAKARGGLGKCKICGCTKLKFWLATSKCPDKPPRW